MLFDYFDLSEITFKLLKWSELRSLYMLVLLKMLQCCNTDVFFALLDKMVTIDVKTIIAIIAVITVMFVIAVNVYCFIGLYGFND